MSTKMSSKKKDLEIIFNLQWKYGPKVAERSNIVGVYDIPSTTLTWEPFKSYILKNSGSPGDDVKVSYMKDGNEIPIESTLDFQTALYFFRKKAMNGEVINLKLERLSIGKRTHKLSTCDAQTECSYELRERAPEWFINYMREFKKEILSEVASAVTMHTAAIRSSFSHPHYSRKSKTDCSKRCRKAHHHEGNEKEVLKTMKMEKKLESKMEKLVNKSKKLKEKKMSLVTKSSDSDAGHSSSKSNSEAVLNVDISLMNAAPLRCEEPKIPHFMGGEVYRHCWAVINNGLVPWTEDTELHFSWGSSLLQPIQKVIPCPLLNPMESGEIEALIHVPKICGKYQMYWHFYHKGRKFGQWLGCEIIVDKINQAEQFTTSFLRNLAARYDIPAAVSKDSEFETPYGSLVYKDVMVNEDFSADKERSHLQEVQRKIEGLDIHNLRHDTSTTVCPASLIDEIEEIAIRKSPSKIQIVENYRNDNEKNEKDTDESNILKDNFLEIHMIDNYMNEVSKISNITCRSAKIEEDVDGNSIRDEDAEGDSQSESISKIDEDVSSNSTLNDMVMVTFPEEHEEPEKSGYAYVEVDGVKTAVPKKFLRQEFLETAEDAPEPKKTDGPANDIRREKECYFGMEFDQNCRNEKKTGQNNDDYNIIPDPKSCVAPQQISKKPYTFPDFDIVNVNLDEIPELFSSDSEAEMCTVKPHKCKPTIGPHHLKELYPSLSGYHELINDTTNMIPLELSTKTDTQDVASANTSIFLAYSSKTEAVTLNPVSNGVNAQAKVKANPTDIPPTSSDPKIPKNTTEPPVPITTVVSEAMTIASSAFKTVVNKIIPSKNEGEPGVWLNGHWVPTVENSMREKNLNTLADMGFNNRDLNATLLARYDDDIRRVVTELVQ